MGAVAAPTVVASPESEVSFPGQPQTVYDWLPPRRRTLIRFTLLGWVADNLRPTA